MLRAASTAIVGVGVTLASTFAPSLGLSVHQQRVGFAIGVILIVAGAVTFAMSKRRNDDRDKAPVDDPCDARLRKVKGPATHLAQYLRNFESFWKAFQNESPPNGDEMTPEKAMDTLLIGFTQFVAAAWIYEHHCGGHPRHQEAVAWMKKFYFAIGKRPEPTSEKRVMSQDLHDIGVAGSNGEWDTPEVRIKSPAEIRAALDQEAYEPLKAFLKAAAPNTKERRRLETTAASLEHLTEELEKAGF